MPIALPSCLAEYYPIHYIRSPVHQSASEYSSTVGAGRTRRVRSRARGAPTTDRDIERARHCATAAAPTRCGQFTTTEPAKRDGPSRGCVWRALVRPAVRHGRQHKHCGPRGRRQSPDSSGAHRSNSRTSRLAASWSREPGRLQLGGTTSPSCFSLCTDWDSEEKPQPQTLPHRPYLGSSRVPKREVRTRGWFKTVVHSTASTYKTGFYSLSLSH